MVNYMVEKTPKGNKTCVQYVKYLAKNGDKMRTNGSFRSLMRHIETTIVEGEEGTSDILVDYIL